MNSDMMRTIRSVTALDNLWLRLEWSDGTIAEVHVPNISDKGTSALMALPPPTMSSMPWTMPRREDKSPITLPA